MISSNDYAGNEPKRPAVQIRAAEYVRMSTDHQKYSTENQSEAIRVYANAHGIELVRTYKDAGKSGLKIDNRDALQQLIEDVQSENTDFTIILVYDVSRWGRFQDADESAYYEYICKRAGISVHYCAEQFSNDDSPISTIIKNLKRAMAGEYSRDLSVKVTAGMKNLARKGLRQGGAAGFGLRRTLIDENGTLKGTLERGMQKSIQTDRVILTLGPPDEVNLVREIYKAFVIQGKNEHQIAVNLNERGILTDLKRPWTRGTVHELLINEKYIGNNVWYRRSFKLKKKHVRNPPDMWIRAQNVFEAIIERDLFEAAKTIINARSYHMSDENMLYLLKQLYYQKGMLSGIIINECNDLPSSSAYSSRFGSLIQAYSLVGYTPTRDYCYIEVNRTLRKLHPEILDQILNNLHAISCDVHRDQKTDQLIINDEFSLSLVIARCIPTFTGHLRWKIHFDTSLVPDITVVVRMDKTNQIPFDYYLFPSIDVLSQRLKLSEDNDFNLDAYRFDDLNYLYTLAVRVPISEIAS